MHSQDDITHDVLCTFICILLRVSLHVGSSGKDRDSVVALPSSSLNMSGSHVAVLLLGPYRNGRRRAVGEARERIVLPRYRWFMECIERHGLAKMITTNLAEVSDSKGFPCYLLVRVALCTTYAGIVFLFVFKI